MHLFDVSRRFYGGNAIVGGGLPPAVGLALAETPFGRAALGERPPAVVVCFFGEGAVAEGEFHESLNLAALWKLPVLFCCENNLYAMGTALRRSEAETDLALKASSYHVPAWTVDGMDVEAVAVAARAAVTMVRAGGGPAFLELRTYRFRAHSMYDPERYRTKDEVARWRELDPIPRHIAHLGLDDAAVAALEADVASEIDEAVAFAEAGTLEPVEQLTRWVLSDPATPFATITGTQP